MARGSTSIKPGTVKMNPASPKWDLGTRPGVLRGAPLDRPKAPKNTRDYGKSTLNQGLGSIGMEDTP